VSAPRHIALVLCAALMAWSLACPAAAADESRAKTQAEEPTGQLRIGVVDLARLIKQSPQAQRAKSSMAKQFANRKDALEAASTALQDDIDRLKRDAATMSEADQNELQASIRDRQRKLQMRQSEYNDDVSAAEQEEFDTMRDDIRGVIDAYAKVNDYDLILGDAVLYATDTVDVTDEVLAELEAR